MLRSLLGELPPPPDGKTGWPWTEEGRIPSNEDVRWPKISIVTPSYNQAPFLEETIRSVLLQGYPNLEYIIIDGGSTDGSVEIIRKYEKWLAYWVSEPDQGQSNAINKGWRRATGEICAWLNSDDVYLPGALKNVARSFIEYPEKELLYGDLLYIDQKSTISGYLRAPDFSLERLVYENYIPQPTTFLKRAALERVGYLNEDLHFCMDYDLWLRIAANRRSFYLPRTLAAFRFHPQSKTTTQFVRMTVEMADVAERFMREIGSEWQLDWETVLPDLSAHPFWKAGCALWFSGEVEQAERYLTVALRLPLTSSNTEVAALSLAQIYIKCCCGMGAVDKVKQLVETFPPLKSLERLAISWIYFLLAQELGHVARRQVLRAFLQAPSKNLLKAVMYSIMRDVWGGNHHNVMRRFRKASAKTPVGFPLSDVCRDGALI
jgi:glycosyltransferase involved in cell wall biosynthesis